MTKFLICAQIYIQNFIKSFAILSASSQRLLLICINLTTEEMRKIILTSNDASCSLDIILYLWISFLIVSKCAVVSPDFCLKEAIAGKKCAVKSQLTSNAKLSSLSHLEFKS